jgi:predicted dehydrogenase
MIKSSSQAVRIGIVGLGNMGSVHARSLLAGRIRGAELSAVCDALPDKQSLFPEIPFFGTTKELISSGKVDAVLLANPHYQHTTCGIEVLRSGLHLLVEKPISVHKADAERLIAAWEKSGMGKKRPVFAAMFNQRTDPRYRKIRRLIQDGELGKIRRINWIITNWFRTHAYYASGGWRATWAGEGGGVLLNQCPHQLDLFQWLFGMPDEVRAFCSFGRYHDIEVEDDVTAYMKFKDGTTAVFITSTGEAPGTNRLEITGERGRLVAEPSGITFLRNEVPMSEFSRKTPSAFAVPDFWEVKIPVHGTGGQHEEIIQNFTDTILGKAKLLAPAEEGIHSVELANAMLLSTFTDRTIKLPMDAKLYERHLKKRINESKFIKKTSKNKINDFSKSF